MKNIFQPKNIFQIKELKEYSYLTFFFIFCAIFLIFVIRPNLKQFFLAKKKVEDLKLIKDDYEKIINKIIDFQSNLEQFRDDYYLINQAIPHRPSINKVLSDIDDQIKKNDLQVEKIMINDVNLLPGGKEEVESVKINLNIVGNFDNFNQFIKGIINQRRLKEISSFKITKPNEPSASESSELKIDLVIDSYFYNL